MRHLVLALALALGLLAAGPACAGDEIQKWGTQVWPGKYQVGFNPFGLLVRFDGISTGGYHMTIDFAARLRDLDRLTLWIGGGFNWAHPTYSCKFNFTGCAEDIQLWGFVMISFEKMLNLPLVPFVQGGVAVDILPFGVTAGTLTGGALSFRFGGGLYYWLLKHLGLGFETHIGLGPGFYPAAVINVGGPSGTNVSLYGNWDLVFGARAAF